MNSIQLNDGRSFKLSLKPSKKDLRTFKLTINHDQKDVKFPNSFSLKTIDELKIYDQGKIGSCTANSIAQALQIKSDNKISISRLFMYFNSRLEEGTNQSDSGANILDCMKA